MSDPGFEFIRYERPATGVARIMLAREEVRNAQNVQMLYEIDAALDAAMQDDEVGAVIIGADGPHFSAGHDLKPSKKRITDFVPKMGVGGFTKPGQEGHMAIEQEVFIRLLLALAQHAQAHHRCRARQSHCGRADADLAVRSDHRQ